MRKHFGLTWLLCLILVLASTLVSRAETFSYIYIQGDKEIPFYVKFEDEMLQRFGKNYYIISELAPGPITIEILFQQNMYAPQKFTVYVPENSFRGFLLMQKEGKFTLYDIHRQFYIPAFNKIEDDQYSIEPKVAGAPPPASTPAVVMQGKEKTPPPAPAKPQPVVADKPVKQTPPAAKSISKPPTKTTPVAGGSTGTSGPKFINNVELKNERTQGDGNMVPAGKVVKGQVAVMNSDCPTAMDNYEFDKMLNKTMSKSSDDRLKYIFERMDNCFTSNQVRQLAETLRGDAAKLTLFKRIYSRVTDQSAFVYLENMMSNAEWRGYFKELVK